MSFGESHGRCVGVIIDGCPAGLSIDEREIQKELDLRRAGVLITSTTRGEEDRLEILSGIFRGKSTGSPICMLVWNHDIDSRSYDSMVNTPRPGHADYPALMKYGGYADYRGGGRFSARITAGFVMAGSVAKKLLDETLGVKILAYTLEIGGIRAKPMPTNKIESLRFSNELRCPDSEAASKMRGKIKAIQRQGDSVGGIVECISSGLKVGLGQPVFSSLDGELSKALFSIPAVKGVEFGLGFQASRVRGSKNNDEYRLKEGKVLSYTNRSGGILGGLSTGMPIIIRVAFKPTSSIHRKQRTVDLSTMKETDLIVTGRHDTCVVPRAIPIVEAIVAVILADFGIRGGFIPPLISK